MSRRPSWGLVGMVPLLAIAIPCAAGPRLDDLRGHLALGFAHVSSSDTSATPGGSLSVSAGIDLPVARRLRAGLDVGYHLLGSRTLVQGSLTSGLDYSLFEALALLHWRPTGRGPDLVVSAGPGLFLARATLAATAIGAAFSPQAIEQTRAGAALTLTATRRRPSPVRVGVEAGLRIVPLESGTWTMLAARVAILY